MVAILAKNSADFLVHAFAVMRAGATPAFVNWRLSARELAEVLALVQPVAIAADAEFTGLADAAWPAARSAGEAPDRAVIGGGRGGGAVPPGWRDGATLTGPVPPRPALTGDTVLALVHTSGTTGRAKAIPLRHGALMMSVADFAIEIGDQVAGSRHLQILPLFHLGGFGQCLQALLTAGTVHIHTAFEPAGGRSTPSRRTGSSSSPPGRRSSTCSSPRSAAAARPPTCPACARSPTAPRRSPRPC